MLLIKVIIFVVIVLLGEQKKPVGLFYYQNTRVDIINDGLWDSHRLFFFYMFLVFLQTKSSTVSIL